MNREVNDKLETSRSRALDELSALEQAKEKQNPNSRFLNLNGVGEIAKAEETSR